MFKQISKLAYLSAILIVILSQSVFAETTDKNYDTSWTIYYRPGVRFGTDDRTLYINDFLVPLYRDEKNILFSNIKYTPNDQDGWEINLGLGYRRLFLDDRLVLGINGFYDRRKSLWGSIHEQWGVGGEVMADVPVGNRYIS
jgi:hypothetical protein